MTQDAETVARLEALRSALLEAFDAGRAHGEDDAVAYEHGSRASQTRDAAFAEIFKPYLASDYPEIYALSTRLAAAEAREAGRKTLDDVMFRARGGGDAVYYMESIKRNLSDLRDLAGDRFSIGTEVLSDNLDWLDCFIDTLRKTRAALQPEKPADIAPASGAMK